MKNIIILILLAFSISGYSTNQDSINQDISHRIKLLKDHQTNVDGAMENMFTKLSQELEKKYKFIEWLLWIGVPVTFISFFQIWKKTRDLGIEKIEKIVIENKQAIKEVVEKQHDEIQFVKNKKILILTKEKANEEFLEKFFKKMNFPTNHTKFETVNSILSKNLAAYVQEYDMIFANNEPADLDFDIIQSYFDRSKPSAVLFYFGSQRFDPKDDQIKNRLSFANARTQIYGNLINLFKYQKLL